MRSQENYSLDCQLERDTKVLDCDKSSAQKLYKETIITLKVKFLVFIKCVYVSKYICVCVYKKYTTVVFTLGLTDLELALEKY